jgi:hypothetical protein
MMPMGHTAPKTAREAFAQIRRKVKEVNDSIRPKLEPAREKLREVGSGLRQKLGLGPAILKCPVCGLEVEKHKDSAEYRRRASELSTCPRCAASVQFKPGLADS